MSENIIKLAVAGIFIDIFFEIAADVCFSAEVAAGQLAAVSSVEPFDEALKQTLDRCYRSGAGVAFQGRRLRGLIAGQIAEKNTAAK